MKRTPLLLALISLFYAAATAQTTRLGENQLRIEAFKHLDLSVTLGTTGLGFDLSTPVSKNLQLRTGFDMMPKFSPVMDFHIEGGKYDDNGNWVSTKFDKMADKFEEFTGYKVDSKIDMKGKMNFYNFKLLIDYTPFRNKNWRLTGGFYWGPSTIARAENTTEEMASLLSMGIYNNIYDKVQAGEPVMGDDTYLSPDLEDKLLEYGRLGIHLGDRKSDGSAYIIEPDKDGMVKARIRVNSFKPYLGFGYGGKLLKNNDNYQISFDCGTLIWGGTPQVLAHDGTDLAKEIRNIRGKVGRYVDAAKAFKAYPVINVRITRRLF